MPEILIRVYGKLIFKVLALNCTIIPSFFIGIFQQFLVPTFLAVNFSYKTKFSFG